MGLFSRSEQPSKSGRRNGSRASAPNDPQAGELRGRARRRLIGALVLVVAAIIILPMLFDNSPPVTRTPVVAQVTVPPTPAANTAVQVPGGDSAAGGDTLPTPEPIQPEASSGGESENPAQASGPAADQGDSRAAEAPESSSAQKPSAARDEPAANASQAKQPEEHAKPKASANDKSGKPDSGGKDVKRTDDGSVALAILQGRTPKQAPSGDDSSGQGKYVLQIAAYTTDQDAQARRSKLVAAGVTNAYVERAVSSGKTIYRLRVGPFSSRDSAQAAQARLRALGYDNGFISTK